MHRPYGYEIPPAPERLDGARVLARVVDGLAFRYHWATDGLRDEDFVFRPHPSSMSAGELVKHVLNLALMAQQVVRNEPERERFRSDDPRELRAKTLSVLARVKERLLALDDEELATHELMRRDGRRYPVWNIMNGPLADALTHVGQLNAWRRMNGNPTPPVNVFEGRAPSPPEKIWGKRNTQRCCDTHVGTPASRARILRRPLRVYLSRCFARCRSKGSASFSDQHRWMMQL